MVKLAGGQVLVNPGALTADILKALEGALAATAAGDITGRVTTDSGYRPAVEPAIFIAYVRALDNSARVHGFNNRVIVPGENEDVSVTV